MPIFFIKKVLTRCGKCAKIIGATIVTLRRNSNFVKLKNKQKSKKFLCKLHKKSRNSLSLEHLFALPH